MVSRIEVLTLIEQGFNTIPKAAYHLDLHGVQRQTLGRLFRLLRARQRIKKVGIEKTDNGQDIVVYGIKTPKPSAKREQALANFDASPWRIK